MFTKSQPLAPTPAYGARAPLFTFTLFAIITATPICGHAQSSVTLFGMVDVGVSRYVVSGVTQRTGMVSGNAGASRLGFRGTEDLGGGYAASFWLEAGLDQVGAGTPGGLAFQRRSTLSVSSPYGELRAGRDYVPTFWNSALFDPFEARGAGQIRSYNNFAFSSIRVNNSLGYFLPKLGGLYGQLQYARGEKPSTAPNNRQGDAYGARLGYSAGDLDVAVAYSEWKQAVGASDVAPISTGRDLVMANIGASYNLGVARLFAFVGEERVKEGPPGNSRLRSGMLGTRVPVGAGEVMFAYSRYEMKDSDNDFSKLSVGYRHWLSKRTMAYATAARLRNGGQAARALGLEGTSAVSPLVGRNATGFDVGLRHSF